MIDGTNATGQTDKAGSEEVADPNAYPRLPPGQAINNHRGGYHPCVLSTQTLAFPLFYVEHRGKPTMFSESAIQKVMKLYHLHWRRSGSTIVDC